MKQIMIQLDDRMAAELERIAPGRSHKRSEFLRKVIARALQEALEARTRRAYERWPDEQASFDPTAWATEAEAVHPPAKSVQRRKTFRKARK